MDELRGFNEEKLRPRCNVPLVVTNSWNISSRKLNLCGIKPTAQNQFGNLFVVDCHPNCCLVLTCFHFYSHFPINFIILVSWHHLGKSASYMLYTCPNRKTDIKFGIRMAKNPRVPVFFKIFKIFRFYFYR